jgi:hypothetical protein
LSLLTPVCAVDSSVLHKGYSSVEITVILGGRITNLGGSINQKYHEVPKRILFSCLVLWLLRTLPFFFFVPTFERIEILRQSVKISKNRAGQIGRQNLPNF